MFDSFENASNVYAFQYQLSVQSSALTSEESPVDICFEVYKIYNFYIERVVFCAGFVLNILNSVVFYMLIRTEKNFKCDMFKYLFLKSIFDAYYLLRGILLFIYDCNKCWAKSNFYTILFFWVFVFYLGQVVCLLSMLCEIGASFNRYRHVSQHFQFMSKMPLKVVLLIFLVYSLVFYVYKFLERDLVATTVKNSTRVEYRLRYNSFGSSNLILNIEFAHSIFRDCICVLIILVINIMTLLDMKKSLGKKKRLTFNTHAPLRNNRAQLKLSTVYRASQAENKITFMVLTTGVLACLGHGLIFVYNLPWLALQMSTCFYSFTNFVYFMSFGANFFIYYFFNKSFRRVLLLKICKLRRCGCFKTRNRTNRPNKEPSGSELIDIRQVIK
jgi:hypothetical protein